MGERIILKASLADLPKIRERYPFIYLEHGRIEVDDSSIKWISADREVIRLPAAVLMTILLGPGTSITHEAVKVLATLNTTVCWVGEDSLMFYAVGQTPTSDTRNLKHQLELASDPERSLAVAKKMYLRRFPEAKIKSKKLPELMVMEGGRVRELYVQLAQKYFVLWQGRSYQPGKFEVSDLTNKLITSCSSALYALVSSILHALGLSPRVGFIHSGSPLPFVYDVADLYKADLVFDLAFYLTAKMAGVYDRKYVLEEFRNRVIEYDFMTKCPNDVLEILDLKTDRSRKKGQVPDSDAAAEDADSVPRKKKRKNGESEEATLDIDSSLDSDKAGEETDVDDDAGMTAGENGAYIEHPAASAEDHSVSLERPAASADAASPEQRSCAMDADAGAAFERPAAFSSGGSADGVEISGRFSDGRNAGTLTGDAGADAMGDAAGDAMMVKSPLDSILPPPVQVIPKSSPTDLIGGAELD